MFLIQSEGPLSTSDLEYEKFKDKEIKSIFAILHASCKT